jgi:prophage tail gpP-like protein
MSDTVDPPLVGSKAPADTRQDFPPLFPHFTALRLPPVPNPDEVAILVVETYRFQDWESVWVQHRYGEPFAFFQFTAAEREPYTDRWQALRFYPDDHVIIELGGKLAMNGIITTRQIAYDKKSHGVQLQGKGITHWAAMSSVESKTGSFDEQSFEQIARTVLSYYPSPVKTIGDLDATPFKRVSNQPGETTWDFLERLARPRGIIMGSDHLGNFLLIDQHDEDVQTTLLEGYNILRCQAIISKDQTFKRYSSIGQTNNDGDEKSPSQAGEMMKSTGGSAPVYSHKITPAEQPVWGEAELQKRAASEALWHEGAVIEVNITVQGWKKPNGDLWRVGDVYMVTSPMISLNEPLGLETATFTQDRSQGTQTTLKLVRPELLKIRTKFQNSGLPLVGANESWGPGPTPTPVPYIQLGPTNQYPLPPGTRIGDNGIEEIPPEDNQFTNSGINF